MCLVDGIYNVRKKCVRNSTSVSKRKRIWATTLYRLFADVVPLQCTRPLPKMTFWTELPDAMRGRQCWRACTADRAHECLLFDVPLDVIRAEDALNWTIRVSYSFAKYGAANMLAVHWRHASHPSFSFGTRTLGEPKFPPCRCFECSCVCLDSFFTNIMFRKECSFELFF